MPSSASPAWPVLARRTWLRAAWATGLAWGLTGCSTMSTTTASSPSLELAGLRLHPAALPHSGWLDWRDPRSGQVWRVWLQMPESTPEQAPVESGYPALLVLDANAIFPLAAQWARLQQTRPVYVRGDPCIIIGIGHASEALFNSEQRKRDYTPGAPGAQPAEGGAEVLLDFLEHTLLADWGPRLRLNPQRLGLFGHSLSGLLVLHALYTRPHLFNDYYAASPSIWWNDAYLLQEQAAFVQARAADYRAGGPLHARVHLSAGSLEEPTGQARPSSAPPTGQRHTVRLQITRAREMAQQLAALQWPQLQAQFALWPDLTHGDTMMPALMQAVANTARPKAWKDADYGLRETHSPAARGGVQRGG